MGSGLHGRTCAFMLAAQDRRPIERQGPMLRALWFCCVVPLVGAGQAADPVDFKWPARPTQGVVWTRDGTQRTGVVERVGDHDAAVKIGTETVTLANGDVLAWHPASAPGELRTRPWTRLQLVLAADVKRTARFESGTEKAIVVTTLDGFEEVQRRTIAKVAVLGPAPTDPCRTCKGLGVEAGTTPCAACESKGRIPCPTCKAVRLVACSNHRGDECPLCLGTDRISIVTCGACAGAGRVTRRVWGGGAGMRTETHPCTKCAQRGVVICGKCRGPGSLPCEACAAKGAKALEVTCHTCKGSGEQPPPPKLAPNELGLSPFDLAETLAKARAELTSLKYEDAYKKFHGKVVAWAGSVVDVSSALVVTVRIEERGAACHCVVQFPPNARAQLGELKKGQPIRFTGTLDYYTPEFTEGFRVLNGKLQ